ncbi:MAG: hypothetical protein WC972_03095 [Trueperaceae bacterium]
MTLRNSFRRLPPFPFSTRARVDQLVCGPRSYVRAWQADGRPLWAAMLAWTPGPQALGVTGDGSYGTLFGANWLVQTCNDGTWVLYQRQGDESLMVVPWDVVPPTVSVSARHATAAFDQAARPVVAWEDASGVRVRRYDAVAGAYGFVGPFAGCDPVLLTDATVNYTVPGSDVVLFYLTPDRENLCYRVQHENYAVQHAHHSFAAPTILDAQDVGGWRYQLRFADEHGTVPGPLNGGFQALLSGLYPVAVTDGAALTVASLRDGAIALVVVKRTLPAEGMTASVTALADGVLASVVINRLLDIESLDALVGSLEDGLLKNVIINRTLTTEGVDALVGSLDDGSYAFVVINRALGTEGVDAAVGSLTGGAYAAA